MLRKVFFFFVVFTILTFLVPKAFASGEFSSNYNVTYDIDQEGITNVTEKIDLKNLTDRFYASSFDFNIGATKISEVEATDSDGPLEIKVEKQGTKTHINVKFNQQIVGKGKDYLWTLKFKSEDFAQKQGKIWQISVPKISSAYDIGSYNLTISVPLSFGEPTNILPQPQKQSEYSGKVLLDFTKDQLTDTGILATFGTNQFFNFNLTYHLYNSSFLPSLTSITLPSDNEYQEISLSSLNPQPENVSIDQDGNYLAWYKLNRNQKLDILSSGVAKLYINSRQAHPFDLSPQKTALYTSSDKYWEKDNPLIVAKANEILKDQRNLTVKQKAQLINQYLVNYLKYDDERLAKNDFNRLGALTALNNPDQALTQEFSDLYLALARAAGIPARELIGYAYSSNNDLRPLSFGFSNSSSNLHSWVEYFDPGSGWVMVDPTWQNTSGGVDYFNKFDLNHLVFLTRGVNSQLESLPEESKVNFSQDFFGPQSHLLINLDAPDQIFSGFPYHFKVTIKNTGSTFSPQTNLYLNTSKIQILGNKNLNVPVIPPQGHIDYKIDLRTSGLLDSYNDFLDITLGGSKIQKPFVVSPFFAFKFFPYIVAGVVSFMVIAYLTILGLHIKRHGKKVKL